MLSRLGPPFAFSVWVAARVLLVHSSTIDHQINPAIHFFITVLRELGAYWAVADRYASLLQRVLDEFAEAEAFPVTAPGGEREAPRSVRILADMRRGAYDLDFLISRQPRLQMVAGANAASAGPTPSRTPAPNELEYLDVFDFFNMPRLPTALDAASLGIGGGVGLGGQGSAVQAFDGSFGGGGSGVGGEGSGWTWDVGADWFMNKGAE